MLSDGVSALYNNYRSDDALARATYVDAGSAKAGSKDVAAGLVRRLAVKG